MPEGTGLAESGVELSRGTSGAIERIFAEDIAGEKLRLLGPELLLQRLEFLLARLQFR